MNEFERKLSEQPFRQPPADLRAAIFGTPPAVVVVSPGTWRDWFWPSPQAWGALAALWVVYAALAATGERGAAPSRPSASLAARPAAGLTLLSFRDPAEINHVLNLPN